ncbi:interferon regulatory factor 3 isoform X2 [Salminus brasiliensis]|uniref:interferon regulatory factor 3 isoform X2 n=1 Tax=Salminus brasiliensis TaxID=930266 RepID=UPI003B82FB85
MAQNKPLFVPWLRQQIDSGQYPGVNWLNPERTLFTIPWKHALRQDSNSDDVLIFRAWAKTSVSPDGKIPGEPSVWKRNFRSALRARGFKLHLDNKSNTANPHKIFTWPEDGQSGESREGSQDYDGEIPLDDALYLGGDMFPAGASTDDILEQCLVSLNINPREQGPAVLADSEVLFLEVVGAVGQMSPAEDSVDLCQFSPLESAFTGTQGDPVLGQEIPVQDTSNDSGSNNFPTHYKVTVYFKGSKMSEQLVENDAGFRIMFRNDPSLTADSLPVVKLPGTDSILDQTQARSTRDILANLGGLEVRKEGSILYGHRWGDSRVYWGLCKHERAGEPRPLAKNRPEPIYLFKNFCPGLVDFIQNGAASSPSYTLYFFLGQNWPDPKNKPWDKKLIMVEVVLTSLERLKLLAVANGASSLQSDELQLSLEQMMEWCWNGVKETAGMGAGLESCTF